MLGGNSRRIAIVGAGISGICLALCLERISKLKNLDLDICIYESSDLATLTETGDSHILWKWATDCLVELGLSEALSSIVVPINNLKVIDAESLQVLKRFPPETDVESGITAMYSCKNSDVYRILMLALAGKIPNLSAQPLSVFKNTRSDYCAKGKWFKRDKYQMENIKCGYALESFQISATTGKITLLFANGETEQADALIGADGVFSTVKSVLNNDRCTAGYTNSIVFSGVVDLNKNPCNIELGFSSSVSYSGHGYSISLKDLGNSKIGWEFISKQQEPNEKILNFTLLRNRTSLSKAISSNPRMSINFDQLPSPVEETGLKRSRSLNRSQFAELSSQEMIQLASMTAKSIDISSNLVDLIEKSEPSVTCRDTFDTSADPLESFTSPDFHPGRVVLIGDAAHSITPNSLGSVGCSLSITDACYLAKLFGKYLDPTTCAYDSAAFAAIASDYDNSRVKISNDIVQEANYEGAWDRSEGVISRNIMRFGLMFAQNAVSSSFETLIERGSIPMEKGLPFLCP